MNYKSFIKELLETNESDYIFANVFIGDVKFTYCPEESIDVIKRKSLDILTVMLKENVVDIYIIRESEKTKVKYQSIDDIKIIIESINEKWNQIGEQQVLPNELFWLKAKKCEKGDHLSIL
ncbi:MAG: hypothetical protein RLO81_06585 [Fulvivirga sp.]|uniref:hypothetical protein n=1 Tax=Fulvivirga sp. TaxID=1931237 RepID=UPI0032EC3F00